YVTSGNGAKLRRAGRSRWTAHASSQLGFTAFDIYDDRMVIKAIDTANAVYDESSVIKVL
ncbi:MAG: metallophosphoesterase, partial [Cyanobacteria bacterium J06598_3]